MTQNITLLENVTLLDVVKQLDYWFARDEEPDSRNQGSATIYAVKINDKWHSDSPAVVAQMPEGELVYVVGGMEYQYLLEIFLVKEVIEVYQEHFFTNSPTDEEKLKAIIYYAEYDTYLPPEE